MRRFCILLTALLMAGCPAKKPAAPETAPSPAPAETPEAAPSATPAASPSPTPEVTPSASPSPAPEASATPEPSASPEASTFQPQSLQSGSISDSDPRFTTTQLEIVQKKDVLLPVTGTEAQPTIAPQPDQPVTTGPTIPVPVPTPEPSATASPAPSPAAKVDHGPVEGTWAVTDEQGDLFDIVLFPNGQAVTDWTKGPDKAKGQHGKWVKKETGAVITYNSLDSDVIEKTAEGYQMKRLSGRTTVNLNMAKPLAMTRVEGPMAKYVGIWKMNQEPDGSYLMMALQSSGRAVSTVNGGTVGTWAVKGKGVLCTWPDNWFDMIEREGKTWQRRSWVGAEANGEADKSEAERVGEGETKP